MNGLSWCQFFNSLPGPWSEHYMTCHPVITITIILWPWCISLSNYRCWSHFWSSPKVFLCITSVGWWDRQRGLGMSHWRMKREAPLTRSGYYDIDLRKPGDLRYFLSLLFWSIVVNITFVRSFVIITYIGCIIIFQHSTRSFPLILTYT